MKTEKCPRTVSRQVSTPNEAQVSWVDCHMAFRFSVYIFSFKASKYIVLL